MDNQEITLSASTNPVFKITTKKMKIYEVTTTGPNPGGICYHISAQVGNRVGFIVGPR